MRKIIRKTHKWVFIFVGIFSLLWVATGVIMSLPVHGDWKKLTVQNKTGSEDYSSVTMSPAEAVARLKKEKPSFSLARSIHFENIQGRIMYAITDQDKKNHLIDAHTGEYYAFSANVAESYARKIYGIKEPILENVVINNHGVGYLWGELPVYRLQFEGHASEEYYVSPVNARVLKHTIYTKISNISSMLHTFTPIQILTGSDLLRWISVLFVGLIFLVGTITGIYLTFPKRKNRW